MKITCPQCNATYNIPEDRISDRKAVFTCKHCGGKIVLNPGGPEQVLPKEYVPPRDSVPSTSGDGVRDAIIRAFPEAWALSPERYILEQLMTADKKGSYKTRPNRMALGLLRGIRGTLEKILIPGERVMHLAGATAHFHDELFFGNGWLSMSYNRYILVATSHRLIAINTDSGMRKATCYFFQFPYEEISKISKGLFGNRMAISFKRGRRRIFNGMNSALASTMAIFIDAHIDPMKGPDTTVEFQEHLCPECFAPLGRELASCTECGVWFKSPQSAALRSLILPGLGNIYLGNRFLGGCEMFVAVILWLTALLLALSDVIGGGTMAVVILLFVNGMDGWLTLNMAQKGYAFDRKPMSSIRA
jgi:hypothetical protein